MVREIKIFEIPSDTFCSEDRLCLNHEIIAEERALIGEHSR